MKAVPDILRLLQIAAGLLVLVSVIPLQAEVKDPETVSLSEQLQESPPLPPTFTVMFRYEKPSAAIRPIGVILLGLGGLAITSGVGVFLFGYFPAVSERDKSWDAFDAATENEAERYEEDAQEADKKAAKLNTVGWALLGAGAAGIVFGGITLGVDRYKRRKSRIYLPASVMSWKIKGLVFNEACSIALEMEW